MTVYLFGEALEGGLTELLQHAAVDLSGYEVRTPADIRSLLEDLRGAGPAMVFYFLGSGQDAADEHVGEIRALHARVVVIACEAKYNSERALRLLARGARDVRSYGTFPKTVEDVQLLFVSHGSPYGRIDPPPRNLRQGAEVFLLTPFDHRRTPFELACLSALQPLGLTTVAGDSKFALDVALLDKLKRMTTAACLTVANLCPPTNFNVAAEVGLAYGLDVPCLLTWKKDPAAQVPADLRGLNFLEYDYEVELAIQLFCALRPYVTWPIQP